MYLVGGAEATGGRNDTAMVYTPAYHQFNDKGERQVWVWNATLPLHFFSRAPVTFDTGQLLWLLWLEAAEAGLVCCISFSLNTDPLLLSVCVSLLVVLLRMVFPVYLAFLATPSFAFLWTKMLSTFVHRKTKKEWLGGQMQNMCISCIYGLLLLFPPVISQHHVYIASHC